MAQKKAKYVPKRTKKLEFEVGFISFPTLKQDTSLMYQFERCLSSQFDTETFKKTRKITKYEKTCVLAVLVFYDNAKSLIYTVLGVVVYCSLENYVCIDYLFLQKEKELCLTHR